MTETNPIRLLIGGLESVGRAGQRLADTEFGRSLNKTVDVDFLRKRASIDWVRGIPAAAWTNYTDWHRREGGLRPEGEPAFVFTKRSAGDLLIAAGGQVEKLTTWIGGQGFRFFKALPSPSPKFIPFAKVD